MVNLWEIGFWIMTAAWFVTMLAAISIRRLLDRAIATAREAVEIAQSATSRNEKLRAMILETLGPSDAWYWDGEKVVDPKFARK